MDMLSAISRGYVWKISPNAATQFVLDIKLDEKVYKQGPYNTRKCLETTDKKVYLEHFSQSTWCLVARHDQEDLLKYIKYRFI